MALGDPASAFDNFELRSGESEGTLIIPAGAGSVSLVVIVLFNEPVTVGGIPTVTSDNGGALTLDADTRSWGYSERTVGIWSLRDCDPGAHIVTVDFGVSQASYWPAGWGGLREGAFGAPTGPDGGTDTHARSRSQGSNTLTAIYGAESFAVFDGIVSNASTFSDKTASGDADETFLDTNLGVQSFHNRAVDTDCTWTYNASGGSNRMHHAIAWYPGAGGPPPPTGTAGPLINGPIVKSLTGRSLVG